jgi:hypothetical protein
MDQHVQETPKKVYEQPSLESREPLAEIAEGNMMVIMTTGIKGIV